MGNDGSKAHTGANIPLDAVFLDAPPQDSYFALLPRSLIDSHLLPWLPRLPEVLRSPGHLAARWTRPVREDTSEPVFAVGSHQLLMISPAPDGLVVADLDRGAKMTNLDAVHERQSIVVTSDGKVVVAKATNNTTSVALYEPTSPEPRLKVELGESYGLPTVRASPSRLVVRLVNGLYTISRSDGRVALASRSLGTLDKISHSDLGDVGYLFVDEHKFLIYFDQPALGGAAECHVARLNDSGDSEYYDLLCSPTCELSATHAFVFLRTGNGVQVRIYSLLAGSTTEKLPLGSIVRLAQEPDARFAMNAVYGKSAEGDIVVIRLFDRLATIHKFTASGEIASVVELSDKRLARTESFAGFGFFMCGDVLLVCRESGALLWVSLSQRTITEQKVEPIRGSLLVGNSLLLIRKKSVCCMRVNAKDTLH